MPKAEVGSTKYIANKMKAKGLQRLRWYCQICEKQCRDENGFKQHTMSEGHVRSMLLVGEDPRKFINQYSTQFKRDFLQLLKTSHGEKKVHMNNFYQEYIRDKEHIHMNATKWPSLTEFAKHLGQEGICRVEEGERGLEIAFVDDSVEAIRRREDVKRKERLAKGDEDMESRLLEQQVKRAQVEAERLEKLRGEHKSEMKPVLEGEVPAETVKMSFSLGGMITKPQRKDETKQGADEQATSPVQIDSFSASDKPLQVPQAKPKSLEDDDDEDAPAAPQNISLSLAGKPKSVNPLMGKKSAFSSKKDSKIVEPEKKMSNAERIMKEEMERKRLADQRGQGGFKRQRLG